MTKGHLSNALSLSCVENYFLAYFKDKVDIRQFYAESFVPFNKVIDDFILHKVSYEHYPLTRVQETAERLGVVTHKLESKFICEDDSLNLIKVNKSFFVNSKQLPWRADHYIALKSDGEGYEFLNNYPLFCGKITNKELTEIYDNATLEYRLGVDFNCAEYEKIAELQFNTMIADNIEEVTLDGVSMLNLRDAILVLRTLRKRIVAWLVFESERKQFIFDLEFGNYCKQLLSAYDALFVGIELQLTRNKFNNEALNFKLNELILLEKDLGKKIKQRRLKNEHLK